MRPWKESSSATATGLPVAFRAHFSAASTASVPELQKNARAPPKRSDSWPDELQHRLGRVEVRGVPERRELALRGGERRRMTMPERDDGDAAEQIEVAAPLDVGEPDAVAGGERHVVARVGRQQRRRSQRRAHASTAVAPIVDRRPAAWHRPPRAASGRSRPRARRRPADARPRRRGSRLRPHRRGAGPERP